MNGRGTFGLCHRSQNRPYESRGTSALDIASAERRWGEGTYDDDEQVDDLARVALDVEDERVRDRGRRRDDDDHLCRQRTLASCCVHGGGGEKGVEGVEGGEDGGRTEGIKWMMRPGSGDLPVGQLEAQNLLPNGRGMPSLASSA